MSGIMPVVHDGSPDGSPRLPSPAPARAGAGHLPESLAPFFPEYAPGSLDLEAAAAVIVERTLQHGNQAEIRWLFATYGEDRVAAVVRERGARHLGARAFAFWRLVLGIETWRRHPWGDATSVLWGNRG